MSIIAMIFGQATLGTNCTISECNYGHISFLDEYLRESEPAYFRLSNEYQKCVI